MQGNILRQDGERGKAPEFFLSDKKEKAFYQNNLPPQFF
jgi:hypothetical protein